MTRKVVAASVSRHADGDGSGVYYPAEVVGLLELHGVTYDTLRRLLAIARGSVREAGAEVADEGWSRYTTTDLVRLDVLIDLCGGRAALEPGRRLNLRGIREACAALRALGSDDPLLEVPMTRIGARLVAILDGFAFEPVTGQAVLPVAGARQGLTATTAPAAVATAKKNKRLTRHREVELARSARAAAPTVSPTWVESPG